jgi:hypothetical protein
MRRFTCLVAVAAAVLAIPTAQSATAPDVSLSASSFQVRYGDPTTLSGEVSNKQAGASVAIVARPFTASGFTRIATVTSGKDGVWTYEVKPGVATTYQARLSGSESSPLLVGVRPAVTLTRLDNGRLRVEVTAAREFAGKAVKVSKQEAGVWTTLAKLRLNDRSRALVPAAVVPSQQTTLRVTMSVNQAGEGYLGGFSPPLVLPSRWVSLSLSDSEIDYGQTVRLSGLVSTREAGTSLTILSRPAAKPEFQPLATLTSGAGGKWSFQTRPMVGMVYEAEFSGSKSRNLGVGVHPTAKARIVSNGAVLAHIGAGRSMQGKTVQIQQLIEGQWKTVAKAKLNADSDATFPAEALPGGTSTLRVAMSVNQAGLGYMGAFGKPFVYQR